MIRDCWEDGWVVHAWDGFVRERDILPQTKEAAYWHLMPTAYPTITELHETLNAPAMADPLFATRVPHRFLTV